MEYHGLGDIQGILPGDFHLTMVPYNLTLGTMALMPTMRPQGVMDLAEALHIPLLPVIHGKDLVMGPVGMPTPVNVTGLSTQEEIEIIQQQLWHLARNGGLLNADLIPRRFAVSNGRQPHVAETPQVLD